MTSAQIIKAIGHAAIIIEERRHWTRGAAARTQEGKATNVSKANAYRYCLSGAIMKTCNEIPAAQYNPIMNSLSQTLLKNRAGRWPRGSSLIDLNDQEGHMAVQSLLGIAL